MSVNDTGGREFWPSEYEATYWRFRLLEEMNKSKLFREAIAALRAIPVYGKYADLIVQASAQPSEFDGTLSETQYTADLIQSEFGVFLAGGKLHRDEFHFADPLYPGAVFDILERFGLVSQGAPAGWAIRPVHQLALGDPHALELPPVPEVFVQQQITINVSPSRAVITVRSDRDLWKGTGREEYIPAETDNRFDDWAGLEDQVRLTFEQALSDLRQEFATIYPNRRNRPSRWEEPCTRLAKILTSRYSVLHRNQRRDFCRLIGIDPPSAEKNRRNPRLV